MLDIELKIWEQITTQQKTSPYEAYSLMDGAKS